MDGLAAGAEEAGAGAAEVAGAGAAELAGGLGALVVGVGVEVLHPPSTMALMMRIDTRITRNRFILNLLLILIGLI